MGVTQGTRKTWILMTMSRMPRIKVPFFYTGTSCLYIRYNFSLYNIRSRWTRLASMAAVPRGHRDDDAGTVVRSIFVNRDEGANFKSTQRAVDFVPFGNGQWSSGSGFTSPLASTSKWFMRPLCCSLNLVNVQSKHCCICIGFVLFFIYPATESESWIWQVLLGWDFYAVFSSNSLHFHVQVSVTLHV